MRQAHMGSRGDSRRIRVAESRVEPAECEHRRQLVEAVACRPHVSSQSESARHVAGVGLHG